MWNKLVLLAGVLLFASPAFAGDDPKTTSMAELAAHGWKLPRLPYPYTANANGEEGSGIICLSTDAKGTVTAAHMVQKIGHPDLDDFVVRWAREEWQGPPNATAATPVTFQSSTKIIDSDGSDPKKLREEGWHIEKPPYPIPAYVHHEEGHLEVEIVTGAMAG